MIGSLVEKPSESLVGVDEESEEDKEDCEDHCGFDASVVWIPF